MRTIAATLIAAVSLALPSFGQGITYPPLPVGATAPDFSLPYATRDSVGFGEITLSAYAGEKTVVLAFYPADWSGGCTKELCTMRDNFEALASLDAVILAISGDYPYSHHEWAKHHSLPFPLLSDVKHKVAPLYQSYNEISGYNKRTVFIVDKKGKIAYSDLEYSTRDMTSFEKLRSALSLVEANDND
jgi:peroxiredoxin